MIGDPASERNSAGSYSHRRYNTLQYPSRSAVNGPSARSYYSRSASNGRNYSTGLEYASDTEALQSPVPRVRPSSRPSISAAPHSSSRSNSLPRTFQRETLLRHPELSMEMDPISGLEDQLSDSGLPSELSAAKRRGYRSPSSFSATGGLYQYKELRRTPSTSAIYETLRRSKELRESLTGSRLSIDNIGADKLRDNVRIYS